MARYSKIERVILNDQKFNQLSDDAQLVFFRLLVHPHLTSLGAMRASVAGLAEEMRWAPERLSEAFQELMTVGMIQFDSEAHLLWFPKFLKYNQPESPNVVKSWETALDYLPECPLKTAIALHAQAFVDKLSSAFQEALPAVFRKPSESLSEGSLDFSKSLRESITITRARTITKAITEAEVERVVKTRKEQEKKKGVLPYIVAPARLEEGDSPVQVVFDCWRTTLGHLQAMLDDKRKALIRKALKSGYSTAQLCEAIRGCSLTPHNMGKNERGQRYDGLHVILRDADQIDRFIRNAVTPPRERSRADALMDQNLAVCQAWLDKKLHSPKGGSHEIQ